jgi:hypothetical protein
VVLVLIGALASAGAQEASVRTEPIASRAVANVPSPVRRAMTIEVARIIGADERASHYRRSDRWHRLDLDGDGQDEWMVVYAIEGFGGGNNYAQYLTTFRYVEPVWFAFETHGVGGKGSLAVDGDVMSYISGQSLIFPAMATTKTIQCAVRQWMFRLRFLSGSAAHFSFKTNSA